MAGFFAEEIPECDVNDSDYACREFVESVFLACGESLPVSVDFEWIFADESWLDDAFKVRLEDGSVSTGDDFVYAGAFRPSFDSGIGLDTDE